MMGKLILWWENCFFFATRGDRLYFQDTYIRFSVYPLRSLPLFLLALRTLMRSCFSMCARTHDRIELCGSFCNSSYVRYSFVLRVYASACSTNLSFPIWNINSSARIFYKLKRVVRVHELSLRTNSSLMLTLRDDIFYRLVPYVWSGADSIFSFLKINMLKTRRGYVFVKRNLIRICNNNDNEREFLIK